MSSKSEHDDSASLSEEAFDQAENRSQVYDTDPVSDSNSCLSTEDISGKKKLCTVSISIPEHTGSLLDAISAARTQTTQADACLIVRGQEFSVHSLVVSSFSKVIREGLSNNPRRVMQINNVSPDVMSYILDFMYTNNSNVNEGLLLDFLMAVRSLQIDIFDKPELKQLEQQLRQVGFQEREATINNAALVDSTNITLPSSVSVLRVNADGEKTSLQLDRILEKKKEDETQKSSDDVKDKCSCSCRKAEFEKEKVEMEQANKERETLAKKLEKCGTKITGQGLNSMLDLPSWIFSSSNITVTPLTQCKSSTPIRDQKGETMTGITPVKQKKTSSPENKQLPNVNNNTPKTQQNLVLKKSGSSPGQMLTPIAKRNLQQTFGSPSHQPFNGPQTPVKSPLYNQHHESVKYPSQWQQKKGNLPLNEQHRQQYRFQRGKVCPPRMPTQPQVVPCASTGGSLGSPRQCFFGRANNSLNYRLPESKGFEYSYNRGRGRGRPKILNLPAINENRNQVRYLHTPVKKQNQMKSVHTSAVKEQQPIAICGIPVSKVVPEKDFSFDTCRLNNEKEVLQVQDTGVTFHLNDGEAEVIPAGTIDSKCTWDFKVSGSSLQNQASGSEKMNVAPESVSTQPTFATETPNLVESGINDAKLMPCVMLQRLNDDFTSRHTQYRPIQEGISENMNPQLPPSDPKIGQTSDTECSSQENSSVADVSLEPLCANTLVDSLECSSQEKRNIADASLEPVCASTPIKEKSKGKKKCQSKKFKCTICHKQMSTSLAKQMHMRMHGNGVHYVCSTCSYNNYLLKNLTTHIKRKHNRTIRDIEKVPIVIAGKKFDSKVHSKRLKNKPMTVSLTQDRKNDKDLISADSEIGEALNPNQTKLETEKSNVSLNNNDTCGRASTEDSNNSLKLKLSVSDIIEPMDISDENTVNFLEDFKPE